ncbi:D-amino-acid dehydrogenase [Tenacibaculum litopenaei]|uniref:NAD(P)/FAD-dependent oxidoreductase n=1 Tax=Tenacibaculum litopenaei TaxID=396016 RepID=UPI0038940B36
MSKKIIIIGGGIIGLSTAYYLHKEGHEVSIVDQSDGNSGASYVNAGIITPSHIISLAAPGMINKGIKWMLSSTSPFAIKPRFDIDFFKWTWLFKKAATHQKVTQSIPIIKDINVFSKELYQELKTTADFDFHFQPKGLMMYYQTDKAGEEEWSVGQRAIQEGLRVELLDSKGIQQYEPEVDVNAKGAVYYHSDAHMTPCEYMKQLKTYLSAQGVKIFTQEAVNDFKYTGKKITGISTDTQELHADEFVLAAGSWTPLLAKKLGINIPVQAGKGYRINAPQKTGIQIPAILMEAKVAVTPMHGFTRFAGTMEIGGINDTISTKRVQTIASAASKYYNGLQLEQSAVDSAACGLRPCSPDGLPYIGTTKNFDNLHVGTGHAMMGWSLGPATGKLLSEIISEKSSSLDLKPFSPDRYN